MATSTPAADVASTKTAGKSEHSRAAAGHRASQRSAVHDAGPHRSNDADGSDARPNTRRATPLLAVAATLVVAGIALVAIGIQSGGGLDNDIAAAPARTAIPAPYDADRAMGYLRQICDIGPRPTASAGMETQQAFLKRQFESLGGTVRLQSTRIRHPETGDVIPMANLIASWHLDRPKRFLLCAHYDTRPFPDRDRRNPKGRFVGANDGGSGVAALMELAHHLDELPSDVGVDLVMFDAEEFVFDERRDKYFLGSTYFAQQYRMQPPQSPYTAGVLLDMVGDKELKIYYERNSLKYARQVARQIWNVADDLGVTAFVPRSRHEIRDDHLPLNQIAGIPTVDLIDFDYPRPGLGAPQYWHTEQDIPENCSGESLAAVVWVVHQWLQRQ
nr:M28 family peptidase [Crateriforma conspicua]